MSTLKLPCICKRVDVTYHILKKSIRLVSEEFSEDELQLPLLRMSKMMIDMTINVLTGFTGALLKHNGVLNPTESWVE